LRPVVMLKGKRPAYDPNQNKTTIQFFFPSPLGINAEKGEIDLISGDVPRIVINASAQVEVDRFEPKLDPPGDQRKEGQRRMK
jgi:hypothetical protein